MAPTKLPSVSPGTSTTTISSLTSDRPVDLEPSLRASLSRAALAIEMTPGGVAELEASYALSPGDRQVLEARKRAVAPALRGSDVETIKRRLARLFGMMAGAAGDEKSTASLISDYAKVLSSQPLWAIDAMIHRVIDSGATFRPSAPDMLKMARSATEPLHVEMTQIDRVLAARIYTLPDPDQRARVLAKMKAFAASLGMPKAREEEDHAACLARMCAEIKANPPQASVELMVKGGYDPLGRALGNNPLDTPDRFDDTLP